MRNTMLLIAKLSIILVGNIRNLKMQFCSPDFWHIPLLDLLQTKYRWIHINPVITLMAQKFGREHSNSKNPI